MAETNPNEQVVFEIARHIVSVDARKAYLKQVCGEDSVLEQRVEALIGAYEDSDSFLEAPPAELNVRPTVKTPIAEQPGTQIGPYKLLQQIGEGGMGVVYMAEQTEPVARRVALKIIKPGMDSRQVIARFEAERQALAVMDHPNIAKVHDAGMTETGRPYFVMELVKGVPITQYCDQHKLSVRERLELFVPVCQAIQHAHQKGIIHRDIKPSNVLVARYDDRPVPKIIDFGVAKATQQKLTEKTVFTQFGQIVGTFEYMSPEQAQLNQLDIDTRSDVYSLGVLLYELLTGQTPFDGERLRSAAFDELLRIIREEDPPRPSLRLSTSGTLPEAAANRHVEPKRLSSLVRGELDWIVMKALEKDRTRRYETATALAADIEHYLNDEPVDACPPSSIYMIGKFTRRNKGWLSTAAVVLLTTLVGLTVSTVLIARERNVAEDSARRATDSAHREAVAARQAEQRLDDARYNLYVAHTRLAREDWEDGQVNRMIESLESHIPHEGGRELRGWEWYYLMSLPRHNLATLTPDIGGIIDVKWSFDQRYLAVAGQIIVVYDAVTKKPHFEIPGARRFAWKPGSHELAVTSPDGKVTVWDANQSKEVRHINDPNEFSDPNAYRNKDWCPMRWSPDGSRIAVAFAGRILVWNAAVPNEPVHIKVDTRLYSATCLDWSPDNRYIAIGGGFPGWVEIWDAEKGESLRVDKIQSHVVKDVAWSPDGKLLASAGHNKAVRIRDATTWETVFDIGPVASNPHDLHWSPDCKHLAVAGHDGRVTLWNVETGQQEHQIRGHRGPVQTLDWSADGQQIATGSADGTVRLTAPFATQECDQVALRSPAVWSPDGEYVAGTAPTQEAHGCLLFSVATGQQVARIKVDHGFYGADFSPDGTMIALPFNGGAVGVWKVEGGEQLWMAPNAHHPTDGNIEARCVDWSPDGRVLASCGTDRTVKLWDGTSGELLRTLDGHDYMLGAVVWSPDGRRLVSTDWRCYVNIWNTRTWAVEHKLMRNPSFQQSPDGHRPIAITSDSRRLAGGGASGIVYIWDLDSGRELLQLQGHTGNIRSVAWTPDGSRLVSAAEDGLIKIWDTTSGREMLSLRGHESWIGSVGWSPDGRRLLSSSWDRTRLWDATAAYEVYGPPGGQAPALWDRHLGTSAAAGDIVAVVDGRSVGEAQNGPSTNDDADASPQNDNRSDSEN